MRGMREDAVPSSRALTRIIMSATRCATNCSSDSLSCASFASAIGAALACALACRERQNTLDLHLMDVCPIHGVLSGHLVEELWHLGRAAECCMCVWHL